MSSQEWMVFAFAALGALLIGAVIHVFRGLRRDLFVFSGDSPVPGQSLIPLTSGLNCRRNPWVVLIRRRWRQNVEFTLADDAGKPQAFGLRYHLLKGYLFSHLSSAGRSESEVTLNSRILPTDEWRGLRDGAVIRLGTREYRFVVTSRPQRIVGSDFTAHSPAARIRCA